MFTPPDPDPRAPRERAMLGARLSWGDGAYGLDATISQISKTGAKLTLAHPQATPADMRVEIPRRNLALQAHVVRREGRDIAIRFVEKTEGGSAAFEDKIRALTEKLDELKAENAMLRAELKRLRGG